MQKKKIMKEEKFELLTVEEMEHIQGGEGEKYTDKFKKVVNDIFDSIGSYFKL